MRKGQCGHRGRQQPPRIHQSQAGRRLLPSWRTGTMDARIVQIDDLPIYNQDLERPAAGERQPLQGRDRAAPMALLFVTPEHNRSHPRRSQERHRLGRAALWAATHGRESLRRSPAHRPARSRARSPSSICARFWATWACSCHGRRGLYHLQAGADRRSGHRHRRGHRAGSCKSSSTNSRRSCPLSGAIPSSARPERPLRSGHSKRRERGRHVHTAREAASSNPSPPWKAPA